MGKNEMLYYPVKVSAGNGRNEINYDAMTKTIEEINLREESAAIVIQKFFRMYIAMKEYRVRVAIKREQGETKRLIMEEKKRFQEEQKQALKQYAPPLTKQPNN
mmetsp:Transcript_44763/g.43350  ORF Transcript_44763/g.43350 Transcript_44763/m.43350 type:complete len:104 (-) Transcript_44763:177-488(-)